METSDTLGRTGLVLDSMPNAETNCRSNGSLEAKDEILRTSLPTMFANTPTTGDALHDCVVQWRSYAPGRAAGSRAREAI